ncbi:hypothetical protein P3T29_001635 [Kitasatospora sp. MAP5-34]|nr:hypothetical protein [Kitasatospora sp. MAP5-34]
MALAKKGSRRIVVDGVEYRWRVSRKPCCDYDGITLGYEVTPGLWTQGFMLRVRV